MAAGWAPGEGAAAADHAALEKQAEQLRVRPGTLARILVHAGLSGDGSAQASADARAAFERLVRRSRQRLAGDAVALVAESREAIGPGR